MIKLVKLIAAAFLAALIVSPAMAKKAPSRARAQVERQVPADADTYGYANGWGRADPYGYASVPGGANGGGYYNGYPASEFYSQRDGW
jgi:hypothetical protein